MATGEPDPLFTFHCADYTVKNNTTAGYCLQLFILKEKKGTNLYNLNLYKSICFFIFPCNLLFIFYF